MAPFTSFDNGQDIRDRTFTFACRVVALCERLCEHPGVGRIMAPQVLRCSTSVAAMLEEARAAESRKDFISKCTIGLKEARESHVRLRIHHACNVGPSAELASLVQEAQEIASIVGAIVRNARRNAAKSARL